MTTTKQTITDQLIVADESIEAVVLEGSTVKVFLKSNSVIENTLLDDVHALVRYNSLIKAIKSGAGFNAVTEVDDMDEYLKEISASSSS